jgi:hypothetical protein
MATLPDFSRGPLLCGICNRLLDPKVADTDPDGEPVHEDCYVLKLRQEDAKKPPTVSPNSQPSRRS